MRLIQYVAVSWVGGVLYPERAGDIDSVGV